MGVSPLKKLINVLKTCSNIKLDKKHYEADYAVELARKVLIPLFHEETVNKKSKVGVDSSQSKDSGQSIKMY